MIAALKICRHAFSAHPLLLFVLGAAFLFVTALILLNALFVSSAVVELRVDARAFDFRVSVNVPVDSFAPAHLQLNGLCAIRADLRGGARSDPLRDYHWIAAQSEDKRQRSISFSRIDSDRPVGPRSIFTLEPFTLPGDTQINLAASQSRSAFAMTVAHESDAGTDAVEDCAEPPNASFMHWTIQAPQRTRVDGFHVGGHRLAEIEARRAVFDLDSASRSELEMELVEGQTLILENVPISTLDLRWRRRGPQNSDIAVSSINSGKILFRGYSDNALELLSGEELDLQLESGVLRSVRLVPGGLLKIEFVGEVKDVIRSSDLSELRGGVTKSDSLMPTLLDALAHSPVLQVVATVAVAVIGSFVGGCLVAFRQQQPAKRTTAKDRGDSG